MASKVEVTADVVLDVAGVIASRMHPLSCISNDDIETAYIALCCVPSLFVPTLLIQAAKKLHAEGLTGTVHGN